jgi:hypothetical protein
VEVVRPRLEVNVESFELGPIRIAVTDADGKPLPGYGLDDCRIEYDAGQVYTPVRWAEKADLRELRGKRVKLQFEIKGAALYGYRFVGEG